MRLFCTQLYPALNCVFLPFVGVHKLGVIMLISIEYGLLLVRCYICAYIVIIMHPSL